MRDKVLIAVLSAAASVFFTNYSKRVVAWFEASDSAIALPDGSPHKFTSRKRRSNQVLLAGTVLATFTWMVWPMAAKLVAGEPLPFDIQIDTADYHNHRWYTAVTPSALDESFISQGSQSDGSFTHDCFGIQRQSWLQANDAIAWNHFTMAILVTSRADTTLLISGIDVEVEPIELPQGTYASFCTGSGGPDETAAIAVDLDRQPPRAVFYTEGYQQPEDVVQNFTVSVDAADAEVFNLELRARDGAYAWKATLDVVVDGVHYAVEVDPSPWGNVIVGTDMPSVLLPSYWADEEAWDRMEDNGTIECNSDPGHGCVVVP